MQNFLFLNGFVVFLLVIYMLFWRTRSEPTRLKLNSPQKRLNSSQKVSEPKMRQLNVYFQFNGHDFDAYEVLGVVAGSSLAVVEKTFRSLLASSPEDSHEFYRKAFEAIRAVLK